MSGRRWLLSSALASVEGFGFSLSGVGFSRRCWLQSQALAPVEGGSLGRQSAWARVGAPQSSRWSHGEIVRSRRYALQDGDLLMSICEEPQRQGSEAIFRSLGLSVEWVYGLPSASAAADNMWVLWAWRAAQVRRRGSAHNFRSSGASLGEARWSVDQRPVAHTLVASGLIGLDFGSPQRPLRRSFVDCDADFVQI